MSITMVDREVTVMKTSRVYSCDGPGCSVTVELPAMFEKSTVPPGWLYVRIDDPSVEGRHYHDQACLIEGMRA